MNHARETKWLDLSRQKFVYVFQQELLVPTAVGGD
jgi:hypothetical protein